MTCVWKKPREILEKLSSAAYRPAPPALLRSAPSPDRWIALAVLSGDGEIDLKLVEAGAERPPVPAEAPERRGAAERALRERIDAALDYRYPYAASEDLPSRLTATELKGDRDPEQETAMLPQTEGESEAEYSFRQVDFGDAAPLTAAEQGTAAHSFLQYLDFARTETAEQLKGELDRLTGAGRLTEQERDSVDLDSVARLFDSPLGREMRGAAAGELRREFRFTLLASAADYFPGAAAEDELLLQGVVDCWYVRDGAVTVVDYKTDRVTAAQAPARAERYRGQLEAYAAALERITGLPVQRRVLWFLRPGVEVVL